MDSIITPTQQLDFANRALPDLFHQAPDQFLYFLNRDGNKFLRFYWDEAGRKVAASQPVVPYGLDYEIRLPRPTLTVALITLPVPHAPGEAYFVALVHRPTRVTPLLRISDTTRAFTLEHHLDECLQPATCLAQWTRRLERQELGPGPVPLRDEFYQAVLANLKD